MVGGGKEQAMSGSHLYLLSAYIGDLTLCDVGRTDATSLRHRTDSDPKSVCLSFEESQYGIFFQVAQAQHLALKRDAKCFCCLPVIN